MGLAYLLEPSFQIVDKSGNPLSNGYIEVYISGTSTKYYCYSDFGGSLHPFRIPLDALGSNIILASTELIYDVFIYNSFGTLVMSRHRVTPMASSTPTSGHSYIVVEGTEGQITVESSGSTDITYKVGLDDAIISELSGIHTDISSTSAYFENKINNLRNVTNLISTDDSISISATSAGNNVTYDLSVKDIAGENGAKNYAFLTSEMPVNTSQIALEYTDVQTNGIHWNTIDQRLEFDEQIKLVDLNYNIEYEIDTANGVTYEDLILYIYSDGQLLDQATFNIDTSIAKHICKFNKKILDPSNLQFLVKVPKNGDIAATIDINDETVKSIAGGGGEGTTYYAGLNIAISDNVISGRDWTPELNAKLDTTAFVLPTAGDGIAISASEISVNAGKGLGFDVDKKLEVKVGDGLAYDAENKVITVDSDVSDVVASVNKLQRDLDTQIITNFDMPNISQVYDFADPSVSTLANGACMLCQAFTIPINNKIRTVSEDAVEPTLLGIYAQQAFGHKIMLALYEYTYAKAGEEHGSSTYVGDTGPVDVLLGVNDYPLKNRNPSITELRSDKVYYATLYLPNAARVNGLMLAGAPNYGNQSVPSEPRLTCAVENITWDGQELDMSDPNATLNHYQTYDIDGVTYYNYYIGPWNSGYNERWTAPRFYMQIRNGEFNEQVIPTAPFVDLGNVLPTAADQVSTLPGFTPSNANSSFRDVTPLTNVTITSFEWIDSMQTAAQWAAGNCVYDSGFATNLSNNNNTTSDLGSVGTVNGQTMYAHRITFNTPLTLTANATYRFLCECFESSSSYIFGRSTPLNIVHCGNNGWYVDIQNLSRYEYNVGKYNKLTDSNNNSYVI